LKPRRQYRVYGKYWKIFGRLDAGCFSFDRVIFSGQSPPRLWPDFPGRRSGSGEGSLNTDKKDGFIRAYRRFYAPRKDKYRGLGILAATILTIPGIRLFEYVSEEVWKLAGKPYEFGPSTLIWQFMLFFALIAFWGLVFFLVAQGYHKRAPVTFRDELIKEGL